MQPISVCGSTVECAASIRSIKYPFKYIHKGGDRATAEVNADETVIYIDGRYLASAESIFRKLHMSTHDQVPNIVRLQIRTPHPNRTHSPRLADIDGFGQVPSQGIRR
jgi:hypothetical protein